MTDMNAFGLRSVLDNLCQIVEVYAETPRSRSEWHPSTEYDWARPRRHAAVVARYHADAHLEKRPPPLVFGWCRTATGGPVTVFSSAQSSSTAVSGPTALSFPPGTRGHPLSPDDSLILLSALPHWTRLGGIVDSLLTDQQPDLPGPGARPNLADGLLGTWHRPFGWLLLAEPLPPLAVRREAERVADLERDSRSRSSSPEHAVRATQLQRRHHELRAAESTGLWRVRIVAGSTSPAEAMAVAGLLGAATDLTGLPYALIPNPTVTNLDAALEAVDTEASGRVPFLASSLLVAAVTRPPAVEIPGLRVVPRHTFDVTPETDDTADPAPNGHVGVDLGQVLDRDGMPAGRLRLPMSSLNRHTFVCGATGAGKSQTIRHLLEGAHAAGLPWLVVEPAKAEYRQMAARLGPANVIAIRPGDPDTPPVGLNPLEPAPGFPLQTHLDLIRALFTAAFEAVEPFPQVLAAAMTRCYEEQGWDLPLGAARVPGHRPRHPTLSDLQRIAEEVVTEIGYGKDIADNVRGFVRVRLSSLRLGTTGRFFEGGHRLDFPNLLERNVVFEIEDVGDDRDKAFLMGTLLIRLVEHLRVAQHTDPARSPAKLRHLSVFEEAHRLLRRNDQPGPAAHAVELFAALLAEIRAYGEGLIIAEQIPRKLTPDIIKNTAIKIIHRLPASDDRGAVGATVNLTATHSEYLVTLRPGTGAVFTDGMDHPLLVTVPDGTNRERASPGTPTRTAPVNALISPRSSTCGTDCHADPCTLRQMRHAQHLLQDQPLLAIWAELAVLGHLTGWASPRPGPDLQAEINALPRRLRDCALSHAIDHAVATRAAALNRTSGPDAFAAHVLATLPGLPGHSLPCDREEPQWLATPYRWAIVIEELETAVRSNPRYGAHPRTSEWNTYNKSHIPYEQCHKQLAFVQTLQDADQQDLVAILNITYGAKNRSVLEMAIGAERDSPNWSSRRDQALNNFVQCAWPSRYLKVI